MNISYLESMFNLYRDSIIPVVVFSDEMEITWYNKSFGSYFPGRDLKNKNISAITKTQLKMSLINAAGFAGRFPIKMRADNKLSATGVFLVLPIEAELNKKPMSYIGFIDDLTQDLNKVLRRTYLGLLEASKLKDDDTGNHIKRVGAYARRLSEECYHRKIYAQINPDFIENIHFLAPMHDVGKIGTPDEILTKRGPLDETQWAIMKEHTINGALILSNYPDIMAPEIARAHHEKWDGSGYLFGLAGEDIPLAARITAIADVYDALRMKRSYKEAFSHEKAVGIILGDRGSHFDPNLVDIFISIHGAFDSIFNALADDVKGPQDLEIEELEAVTDLEEVFDDHDNTAEEVEELEEL